MHVPIFKREIPEKIFDCNETILFGLRDDPFLSVNEGVLCQTFDPYISSI